MRFLNDLGKFWYSLWRWHDQKLVLQSSNRSIYGCEFILVTFIYLIFNLS